MQKEMDIDQANGDKKIANIPGTFPYAGACMRVIESQI